MGFDCNRRHHRAGDDDFSAAQPLAESREHVRDVPHDVDPFAGIGLRIAGAREFAPATQDPANETVRCAAGARRRRTGEHHVALIDVAAEDALRIRGRLCDIDDLDRRRDAGDRGFGGGMISAGRDVASYMDGDLRLGHGLGPARERYVCSGMNERLASQESEQRPANVEPLEHLRRSEADLPAQRCVAAVEALAPHLELRA